MNLFQYLFGWIDRNPKPTPEPEPEPEPNPPLPIPSPSPEGPKIEDIVQAINVYRKFSKVSLLGTDPTLTLAAQFGADELARTKVLQHNDPFGRLTAFHIKDTYAGEDISYGLVTAESIARAWYNDPPHRQIMLDPNYKLVGVGYNSGFCVADFVDKV